MEKKFYRVNQYIRAPKLRVIGEDGKQIGLFTLSEALEKANQQRAVLVEIAPRANPPVAKIIDFKKFLYFEQKKERKSKKGVKGGEVKEVRMAPFIAKADLDFRIKRTLDFLGEGNKVKVTIRFIGRQLSKKEFGYELLKTITEALRGYAEPENDPKWMGPNLTITYKPVKGAEHDQKEVKNTQVTTSED